MANTAAINLNLIKMLKPGSSQNGKPILSPLKPPRIYIVLK